MSPLARNIRVLRKMLGLTRFTFARVLVMSPGTVVSWETGLTVPTGGIYALMSALKKRLEVIGLEGQAAVRKAMKQAMMDLPSPLAKDLRRKDIVCKNKPFYAMLQTAFGYRPRKQQ